jgi:signal transduction histidine kinase/CheY-like chemotaxis protein
LAENRVLILAPRGRDAAIACELLRKHELPCMTCASLDDLVGRLAEGAGAVLVTEETLAADEQSALIAWIAAQPKWSDMPFVVLANGNKLPRSALSAATIEKLGNVVLLDRPLHADALIGALRSALKARRRQYEIRDFANTLERSVSERTRELETARESLQIALDAAEMGSWDLDLVNGFARRTLRHDEIFGYKSLQPRWSRDIFLGHVVPGEREAVAAAFDAAARSGALDIECRIHAADGSIRWIAAKGRAQHDAEGRPARMTGVVADITARREADAQLAQAQKMDSIGQLTGGVAHDFNNLLTPIVGGLDMLRRRYPDDDRAQRLLGGALQAAERAATLTQRLLAFARRQTLEPQSIDTGQLIDGMIELVRRSLGPTIDVAVDVPPHLPAARVDPNQLELALLNLAINARDAMPGGGKLTIAAGEAVIGLRDATGLKPGRYVRLIVTDSGTGMDKATLARAVEPFFSTKGVGKGTGLGLSMVHGLAAQSGGTLQIASERGKGTTIRLWLPASDDVGVSARAPQYEPVPARRASTVLLVDDEELVRMATADMLRDLGYSVVEVSSGAQAFAVLRSGAEIDLLVTDYLMPGMSGAGLIKEAWEAGCGVPALLVTGYANAGQDVPANVPRLSKPYRQGDLAARLDELLDQAGPSVGARMQAVNKGGGVLRPGAGDHD